MQLIPGRTFTIVRQLNNPFITDTFYVRAVIRDAYTDTILATVNLTDKTGQRFKGDWIVVQDALGLGRFVSIVTSVYTDSGYTTKSENYGDEENTYLVAVLPDSNGRGASVDYRAIRTIIKEEMGNIPDGIDYEKVRTIIKEELGNIPEVKLDKVLAAIGHLEAITKNIPSKHVDIKPIMSGLEKVVKAIDEKEVTPATDLSLVLDKIAETNDSTDANHEDMKSLLNNQSKDIVKAMGPEMTKVLKKTKLTTAIAANFSVQGKTDPTEKVSDNGPVTPAPVDHHSLAASLATTPS